MFNSVKTIGDRLNKHHIKARKLWESFSHDGVSYCLKHLTSHEVIFKGNKENYKFIVTYGLHCFAKNEQQHSIPVNYSDSFETREIDLERYHLSKYLRGFIENLDSQDSQKLQKKNISHLSILTI